MTPTSAGRTTWRRSIVCAARPSGRVGAVRAGAASAIPQDVASRVWLGELYLQLGQPDQAAPRFAQALALQPASISARFGLGPRRAGEAATTPRAVTHFEDVLRRDATAVAAHYPLSLAYAALGQTAKADAHLKQRASRDILPADPLMVELDTVLESPQSYETRGIRSLEAKDVDGGGDLVREGARAGARTTPRCTIGWARRSA